jgi:23S rRNA pseudouridine1911/1915/1917 synthase
MSSKRRQASARPEAPPPPKPTDPQGDAGPRPLDSVVRALLGVSWTEARARITSGKIRVGDVVRIDPLFRVRDPSLVTLHMNAPKPRTPSLPPGAVVHVDAHVVVVDKPAGVSTVPYDEGETGTLDERVRDWLAHQGHRGGRARGGGRPPLGVVHRLDKETSGLLVFTRTWLAKQSLTQQFREHTVLRRYLAIVSGDLGSQTFRSEILPDRGDGLRGSRAQGRRGGAGQAQRAVTHVTALERLADGRATLVECRLETGRTHQIRIHLSEAGHPLVGEQVYVREYRGEVVPAPRMMLHAAELGFVHPATEEDVRWEKSPPADFAETLARLRMPPRDSRLRP